MTAKQLNQDWVSFRSSQICCMRTPVHNISHIFIHICIELLTERREASFPNVPSIRILVVLHDVPSIANVTFKECLYCCTLPMTNVWVLAYDPLGVVAFG